MCQTGGRVLLQVVSKSCLTIFIQVFGMWWSAHLVCGKWSGESFSKCRVTQSRSKRWSLLQPCVYITSFVRTVWTTNFLVNVTVIQIMCPLYLHGTTSMFLSEILVIRQLQNRVTGTWINFELTLQEQSTYLDHEHVCLVVPKILVSICQLLLTRL